MCDVCCKEFRGWCRSFTWTELLLAILEGVLLLVLIGFLTFLILHFLACSKQDHLTSTNITANVNYSTAITAKPSIKTSIKPDSASEEPSDGWLENDSATLSPDIQCTWTPSEKTEATTAYYDQELVDRLMSYKQNTPTSVTPWADNTVIGLEKLEYEGEEPEPLYKSIVLALVKVRPLQDLVYGCILTIVSKYWTVTAASCIEAIEEVDSLDSFVMMETEEKLGDGATHSVADVQIHPFYQGTNRSYDLVALKSEDSLLQRHGVPVALPSLLDYYLSTVGEEFSILGHGEFRSVNTQIAGRRVREVRVYSVAAAMCQPGDSWAPRHLRRGGGWAVGGACGAAGGVCAGVRAARGGACGYCAGTPLVWRGALRGLRGGGGACGAGCEPALYVNVAALADWIRHVVSS